MIDQVSAAQVNREELRQQIQAKYADVALEPDKGFHFHTGRPLAKMLGYTDVELAKLPDASVDSFVGTGNPFSLGHPRLGEVVADIGCGAGLDALLAAQDVGPTGRVIGVDMTEAMVKKTRLGADQIGLTNVEVRLGYAEALPIQSASVDVVISNGVINLCPDKVQVMKEVWRVLRPGGRVQIGDIIVHKVVPQDAKDDIDLWSG